MFRAVIVAAVSTPEQAAADRESLPEQLRDCREACERHGWRITREIVIPGHSREYWSLAELCADCPEYQELVDLVEAESVNLVVCMRLARLCRTVPLLTQLTDLCARHQAQIYAVREPQEPLPPDKVRRRRGVAGVLSLVTAALSEEEQQVRVERLHQGMVRRIKAGLPAQSRLGQYGYSKAALPSDVPEVDDCKAHWVRWIYERRLRGWGCERIANSLNDLGVLSPRGGQWYGNAVRVIVSNPLYRGAVRWGGHANEHGRHEAIVDADTWHRAQQPGAGTARRNPRALTGLAVCGHCGWRMVYFATRSSTILRCSQYASRGGHACVSNGMSAAPIEAEVLRIVREVLHDPAQYARYAEPLGDDAAIRSTLEGNLQRVQAAAERWARAYEQGAIGLGEYKERRTSLDAQADAIAGELTALDIKTARRAAASERLGDLGALLGDIDAYTPAEMNAFLRLIVDRIVCVRGQEPVVTLL